METVGKMEIVPEKTNIVIDGNVVTKTTVEMKDLSPLKKQLAILKSKDWKPEPEPTDKELIAFAKTEHPYYRQPSREMQIEWLEKEIERWQLL